MRFERSSGILLHPTSLPGQYGCGDFGEVSYHFINWLSVAGQKLWQILPLEPTGYANSPYMALSAFAGNPLLIGVEALLAKGWITREEMDDHPDFPVQKVEYESVTPYRIGLLRKAAERFFSKPDETDLMNFEMFNQKNREWLEDYALFQALNVRFSGVEWTAWDAPFVTREPKELEQVSRELRDEIRFWMFTQWQFYEQWLRVKNYANDRGIKIIGDIPIFVSHHSADVWSHRELFYLDKKGNPSVVAGVPPDYFSETGQRWGNPLYRWDKLAERKYDWWIERFRRTLKLVDIVRVDHFRGFAGYWEIPATEKTAVKGRWVEGPKDHFFKTLKRKLVKLPIIAEDLGVITEDVEELREQFDLPGMKVLQFAFGDDPDNPFLPHNYISECVVYTGTHDNDTTLGWYEKASEHEQDFLRRYAATSAAEIHWDLIALAARSVADVVVFPMQDILGLGSESRMNLPGTTVGNWEWRFSWSQVGPMPAERLYQISALCGRTGYDRLNLYPIDPNKRKP
ncbi:MAG: 4-alpha-glucanotransferase [bacterium]